jgi:subtilisin family serine protease
MMKRLTIVKVFGIILIIILLFANGGWPASIRAAGNNSTGSKVTSLLSMHLKMKKAQSPNSGQTTMKASGLDSPANQETTLVNKEKVFLYFAQKPTTAQINELNGLGVTVYPNSWIPPVNNFKNGFVLADMPVDKLDTLTASSYIVTMDTAEQVLSPQNDQARAVMNVGPVWQGGDTGAGVTVAVIDSGIDTSNPDFPALNTSNSKDYSSYPTLDDTITNTVTGHGTHVAGSVLGRGVNSLTYKGVAPDASLVFLKVGNDTNGDASSAAIVAAVNAAVNDYHAKIINLSYGSWSVYHDGTDPICQAVDLATSLGTTVFAAAGNNGSYGWHYSGTVNAGSSTDVLLIASAPSYLGINMVWFDGLGTHNTLNLQYLDANHNPLPATPTISGQSESTRGTESNFYQFNTQQITGNYYIRVQNASPNNQQFHLYYMNGSTSVQFSSADPQYPISSPAEADSAIAVGSYVSRNGWINYKGVNYQIPNQNIGSISNFSSRGPRVDSGAPVKPEIVAPGSAVISIRDSLYTLGNTNYDPSIIDNDGVGLGTGNNGPANYYVMEGTSMASPIAAGVAALMLNNNPSLTPAQIKYGLEMTANPNGDISIWGYGLIDAHFAIGAVPTITSCSDAGITACSNFSNYSTQHTVYIAGFNTKATNYLVSYYDGSNKKVASHVVNPANFHIDSYTFAITDSPGTWHAVVSEPQFISPAVYDANWPYVLCIGVFNVQNSAIFSGFHQCHPQWHHGRQRKR